MWCSKAFPVRCVLLTLVWLTSHTPVWASFNFDGTNDTIASADNAAATLNQATFSIGVWVKVSAQPGAGATPIAVMHSDAAASGPNLLIEAIEPGTSGFRLQFVEGFASAYGVWATQTDLSLNTWYHFGCDYDSNTANDPICYVNGSSVSLTEVQAPSGARNTNSDTFVLGTLADGSNDFNGRLAEVVFYSARRTSTEWANLAKCADPSAYANVIYRVPLRTATPTDAQGTLGTLTATGATYNADHPCKQNRQLMGVGQ